MNNSNWKKLICRASEAFKKAALLRKQAEAEYERRFGFHPSDVNDDWWIDTMEGGGVDMSRIIKEAENCKIYKEACGL